MRPAVDLAVAALGLAVIKLTPSGGGVPAVRLQRLPGSGPGPRLHAEADAHAIDRIHGSDGKR